MHQFESDCHRRFDLALPESKVVALALKQEAPECVSAQATPQELAYTLLFGFSAFSVSVSTQADPQELAEPPSIQGVAAKHCTSALSKLPNDCTVDPEENVKTPSSDRQLEQFISNLLRYGVFMASATVLLGGILYLIRYGAEPADYQFFQAESAMFSSPTDVMTAVLSGQCQGIIQLGLLILVATPIARVAFSVLAFLRQRDFTYVMLTLFVLSGLIYSLIGAYV